GGGGGGGGVRGGASGCGVERVARGPLVGTTGGRVPRRGGASRSGGPSAAAPPPRLDRVDPPARTPVHHRGSPPGRTEHFLRSRCYPRDHHAEGRHRRVRTSLSGSHQRPRPGTAPGDAVARASGWVS